MDQLEALRATEEIRHLQATYARYADEKRWKDLASLFKEGARFKSVDPAGETVAEMVGREGIQRRLGEVGSPGTVLIHQLFTAEIEILTASTAKAVWAMADLIFREGEATTTTEANLATFTVMRGWGHYHNEYEKTAAGWLIADSLQTRTRLVFE
jgi:hypothetical protein